MNIDQQGDKNTSWGRKWPRKCTFVSSSLPWLAALYWYLWVQQQRTLWETMWVGMCPITRASLMTGPRREPSLLGTYFVCIIPWILLRLLLPLIVPALSSINWCGYFYFYKLSDQCKSSQVDPYKETKIFSLIFRQPHKLAITFVAILTYFNYESC